MLKQFLIVSLLSMTPWGEWALAIPAGLIMNLPFAPLLVVAFASNLVPVLFICVLWNKLRHRLKKWQGKKQDKAQSFFKRYGIHGLVFLAPVSIGVYISSATALLVGFSPKRTILLHIYSLTFWGVIICILYVLGLKAWNFLAFGDTLIQG